MKQAMKQQHRSFEAPRNSLSAVCTTTNEYDWTAGSINYSPSGTSNTYTLTSANNFNQ